MRAVPLPSDIYDENYFLSERCEGYESFREGKLSFTRNREIEHLRVAPGLRVLDAGCGRGELLHACAEAGAKIAGLDYSEAAVQLTKQTLADVEGADIRHGDVTELPWPDDSFDRAILADVIEHLDPDQADAGLRELRRVLKPGGMLLVHTAPNRLFRRFAWPALRPLARIAGARETADRLDDYLADVLQYHVNELSPFSLPRSLRRAGFAQVRGWVERDVIRSGSHRLTEGLDSRRLFSAASMIGGSRPLRILLGNDLYASGHKPGAQ